MGLASNKCSCTIKCSSDGGWVASLVVWWVEHASCCTVYQKMPNGQWQRKKPQEQVADGSSKCGERDQGVSKGAWANGRAERGGGRSKSVGLTTFPCCFSVSLVAPLATALFFPLSPLPFAPPSVHWSSWLFLLFTHRVCLSFPSYSFTCSLPICKLLLTYLKLWLRPSDVYCLEEMQC